MNLFKIIKDDIKKISTDLFGNLQSIEKAAVEFPKNSSQGHFASNVAMLLKNDVEKKPIDIAKQIITKLTKLSYIESANAAGPGFININVKGEYLQQIIPYIMEEKEKYGDSDLGQNSRVNIEFLSANPTGPLHIGHSRIAINGDALCSIMKKAGYDVCKEYYINDAGSQIETLAKSTFIRYKNALGANESIPEGMYPGEYLIDVAQKAVEQYGDSLLNMPENERLKILKKHAVACIMQLIKDDLKLIDIEFDVFTSEQHDLHDKGLIEAGIESLTAKQLIYKGTLPKPKGKVTDDWEEREQLLFKSSEYGDDVDRPLVKSDGSHTYFAADVGYHINKIDRGFNQLVMILGADHGGYIKRMKAMVKAISNGRASIDIKINQLVNLFKGGAPIKMSKRSGNFVTIRDVVDEVGSDILRFVMLSRKGETVFDFDFDKVREQSNENPVFYVQYASARTNSIIRKASEIGIDFKKPQLHLLSSNNDIKLLMKLVEFPKIVESAALFHEPHRVAFYLQELAQEFHSYWALGNTDHSKRVIIEDDIETSKARICLVSAVQSVISAGLHTLGIKAMESM